MPIAFLALFFSKLVYTSSVRICHALCMLLGAFPVESTVRVVLEESKYSGLDNWLLCSIPNFLYCTFSFELVQATVQFPESVQFAVQISTGG